MPLTPHQREIATLLAKNRSPESYLAGGSALHFQPRSKRYSNDLDYFHDSEERVAGAFSQDKESLEKNGYLVEIELSQAGYIRALVKKSGEETRIEWAHDSAWRFMPPVEAKDIGYILHPIDLAINKLLALVGRDEARDFLDVMYTHDNIISLGAQIWAAAGKDPGFTPLSLLEMLKRRGRYRPDDFERLMLTEPVDLQNLKGAWLKALEDAEDFIKSRPPSEVGCLYYSAKKKTFVTPSKNEEVVCHYGRPGGVMPVLKN